MDEHDDNIYTYCNNCKQDFDDSFQLVDHLLDDDEEFDPYLLLDNGYKFMVGSMLRLIHKYADNSEKIKLVTQQTYTTLFAIENGYDYAGELIEDMVVDSSMDDFDGRLKTLLDEESKNGE